MYVELKCKSNFSFLRGASDARDYVARASELSLPAVAITDVNGVYGLPRAYEVTKNLPKTKLICGAELTLEKHPPITLIAPDREAYGSLCRLITKAHAGKEKGKAVLTFSELAAEASKNLIAIPDLTRKTNLSFLKEVFADRLYLPLCRYLDGLDEERTVFAREMSRYYGLPIVATNDVHYHVPERRVLQDCLTCIREGVGYRDAGFLLFGNQERYLKSPFEMASLFRDLPEALAKTLEIAERCTFSLVELRYIYPTELIPEGFTPQTYLDQLVREGAREIYKGRVPENVERQIRHELALIEKLDYASYFLTIHDIVAFARSRNIICQGRGSAANSICCYCLGITAIDPVQMNLLFERFISEERGEPPDIDVDFEHERREEVIQYIYERYGRHRAGMVAAVRTYRSRSALIELSKAIGVPTGTITAYDLERRFAELAGADADKLPLVESLVEELVDFPRHLSIHSGGFTLSADPIIETVPIEPARMEDRTIIQWDKNDLDTVGLLKVDVLALGFLTALHKICDLLKMDWRDIPGDDRETYKMIQRAETEGTFQIESRAQKSMLPRTLPNNLYDLVVQVAIVRPGPNVGNMVRPYVERREMQRRGTPYRIPDPDLEPVLGRTYGVPIFQEQIMKLAIVKAGFSAGEADQLRRALAAFRSAEAVDAVGKRLHERLVRNGTPREYADELLGYVQGYAHYGFPESHAASFALIAYKSAYLKCHHPAEFLCGLINSQPMGFYPIDTLINEAKRKGVVVLPVDPNLSDWDAKMDAGRVRMGFRNLRGLGEEECGRMLRERERKRFSSLLDFVQRSGFSREVIERMALGDAFRSFGLDQRNMFWASLEFQSLFERASSEQLPLFSEQETKLSSSFEKMSLREEMSADYRAFGYSLRGNMMRALRQEFSLPATVSTQFKKMKHNAPISISGVLMVLQRPPSAKGVAFMTLEDEFGAIDVIFKPEVFEPNEALIRENRFLIVTGVVQCFDRSRSILARSVEAVSVKAWRSIQAGAHPRELGNLFR